MPKIFIIGSSGSGKTTLAQELSTKLHIPHHDLDKIGWKNGSNAEVYVDDAIAIAAQPDWIAEGNFIIWTDPLLYQADYIVLLEISWPVAAWRIVTRHISKSLRGVNPYPGINGIKLLFILLKDTRTERLNKVNSNPAVAESVRQYIEEHEADPALADTETLVRRWEWCIEHIPYTADFVSMYLKKYQGKVFLVRNKTDRERLVERLNNLQLS
jgi:adenylate kinase family enzyme